jgi:hypothetical protein
MSGKDDLTETTAAQVTAELLRRGFGPDERVTIIIEAVEGVATTRQKSQVCVVVGRAGGESGGAIGQPNLAESIRRRFAPLGGVDVELSPRDVADEPLSFEP